MKTIYKTTPPVLTLADKLAFEMLKAQALNVGIASFVITPSEFEELKASAHADVFTHEDYAHLKKGTYFLGVPLIITESEIVSEQELHGFEASARAGSRRYLN